MNEYWIAIYGWSNYMVSSEGRIRRQAGGRGARPGHILRQRFNRDGYAIVDLYCGGVRKAFLVSRLVCGAFNGPPARPDYHAAHKDGDRANNRASNLRWATKAQNEADKELHGTRRRGEAVNFAKLTKEQVLAIREDARPQRLIAQDYGVAQGLVSMVKAKKVWAHV